MAVMNKKLLHIHYLKVNLLSILLLRRRKKRNITMKKKMWMRRLFLDRRSKGLYTVLVKDLMLFDHEYFFKAFRMTPTIFEELLSWISPIIEKSSKIRDVTTPSERLCITLWHLASGDAQISIASSFRVSPPTVTRIIQETCGALWDQLKSRGYLEVPDTELQWRRISKEFELRWNFPHCLGAIDGKHVVMQAPACSGSEYFNYKKTHSIVLMAVCNARYEFTMVDIGDAGRQSDGGVYKNSQLGYAIDHNTISLPPPSPIGDNDDKIYPYVFVADDAFQMKPFMLKPYARIDSDLTKKIFNYRLSRARRLIENCFGIAAARFRIFRKPIVAKVENVIRITKAVVSLHNYLMKRQNKFCNFRYCPPGFVDSYDSEGLQHGEWREQTQSDSGLLPISSTGSNNYSREAKEARDNFRTYFNSAEGQVSWQLHHITRTIDPFDE